MRSARGGSRGAAFRNGDRRGVALADGSRVGVVGGGPAGSLFGYFVMDLARTAGFDLSVDLYEPRDFTSSGPAGCNHCGGIVSESLVQLLATEGVNLPEGIVQRGIDSYILHTDVGEVRIQTPLHERRIAAVYRGNGPRQSEQVLDVSFDGHLLNVAANAGVKVIRRLVSDLDRRDGLPRVSCSDGSAQNYDLLVMASGINSNLLGAVERLGFEFRRPNVTQTFIAEFRLGRDWIEQKLGRSMHVFLLDLPRLEFGALIPKGEFVTACLLGEGIDGELVESFLASPEVNACFPGGRVPFACCFCFPRINVGAAEPPYADRVVMVGDCGATRLFKDGIGAAYRTAKIAASTAVFHGVSAEAFGRHYGKACRGIERDNGIGKLLFRCGHVAQHLRPARRAMLRMTIREQERARDVRRLSQILWDLFTGSAPYRSVLAQALHPAVLTGLAWNLTLGGWSDPRGEAQRRALRG